MKQATELFRFEPATWGVPPENVKQVHIIGEFNHWGKDRTGLDRAALHRDAAGRWCGLLEVPYGLGVYKYLLNETVPWPDLGLLRYAPVTTPRWAQHAIWYQIFVDRFRIGTESVLPSGLSRWEQSPDPYNSYGGNLKGVQEGLSHLRNLFGTLQNKALYLNPLHLSRASNHKYWPEDFAAIDPLIGTEDDLASLAAALHQEGARLILDLVYNHTGLNHPAFVDVLQHGPDSAYRPWYRSLPESDKILLPVLEPDAANVVVDNDPRHETYDPDRPSYFSIWGGKYRFPVVGAAALRDATIPQMIEAQPHYRLSPLHSECNYGCWVGLFELPDLNHQEEAVREHLFEAGRRWIRLGVDGFRLDVPDQVAYPHSFWHQFRTAMEVEAVAAGRAADDLYIVGEIWTAGHLTSTYLYGDAEGRPLRFDAVMNYPVRQAILDFMSGDLLVPGTDGVQARGVISVAEMDRRLHTQLGVVSWGVDRAQYNIFSSHDTRRIRTVLRDDRRLEAALLLQFCMVGAPTVYYGDEIGMPGGPDPESRAPLRWDVVDAVARGARVTEGQDAIFAFFQQLARVRDANPCLVQGLLHTVALDEERPLYAFTRWLSPTAAALVIILRDTPSTRVTVSLDGLLPNLVASWRDPLQGGTFHPMAGRLEFSPAHFARRPALLLLAE